MKGKILKISFDFMLATLSTLMTFFLYFHGHLDNYDEILQQSLLFAGFYAAFSIFFGTHRTVWRYTSSEDLLDILRAASLTVFTFGVWQHFYVPEIVFKPTFAITQAMCLLGIVAGQRLAHRFIHEGLRARREKANASGSPRSRILLVGAGSTADKFIRAANANPHYGYEIVGVVNNDRTLFADRMHGVPILGKGKHLETILNDLRREARAPQRLVFTEIDPATGSADLMDIPVAMLERAEEFGLRLSRLPDITSFREGLEQSDDGGRLNLKPIAIEDLLGRPQAQLDMQAIRSLIAGKRVVVTGAGGSIGSELSRQIIALKPAAMVLLDFSEYNLYELDLTMADLADGVPYRCALCNVRVEEQVRKVFADFKPEIVFHAAALKHVPLVELNASEGVLTNVSGTRIVAEACRDYHVATMVQISTDKAVNPCNVMGATKRLGEAMAQAMDLEAGNGTRFVTVRFGNVLGSSGSVVPLFRKQLEKGGPLTVTHPDICRYFMTIREAVSLVLQASSHALSHPEYRGQILVLDMGAPVKIADVARQMIRLANLRPDIDVKIEYIGLRPGEKMYEELFDDGEEQVRTDSPSILAARSKIMDADLLRRSVANLEDTARKGDDSAVIRLLTTIVPGYTGDPTDGHPEKADLRRKKA
ncbi:MAG TPA: nucleoside-diphosphate sugar epimerase/dehydratase [Alphaproteobacteria bacterium]